MHKIDADRLEYILLNLNDKEDWENLAEFFNDRFKIYVYTIQRIGIKYHFVFDYDERSESSDVSTGPLPITHIKLYTYFTKHYIRVIHSMAGLLEMYEDPNDTKI